LQLLGQGIGESAQQSPRFLKMFLWDGL
jgi:hypothetical protein